MRSVPSLPLWLGLAGLTPQLACLGVMVAGPEEWFYSALTIAWGYAALIFSFLGGLWWGLAAAGQAAGSFVPRWLWVVSVVPSLMALASYLPWIFAQEWPGPSLTILGFGILASLGVDRAIPQLTPEWWLALRLPLSLGLGFATLAISIVAQAGYLL